MLVLRKVSPSNMTPTEKKPFAKQYHKNLIKPVQLMPSPVKPILQEHTYDPSVLLQVARW